MRRSLHVRLVVTVAGAGLLWISAACTQPKVTSSPAPPPASASASSASEAGVGHTINLTGLQAGEQMAVTLVKVADPAQPTTEFDTPQTGKRLVGIQLKLTNIGTEVYKDSPDTSATLVDTGGQRFNSTLVSEITAGPVFPGPVTITAGDSAVGFVVFEIPTRSAAASLQFALDSGSSSQTGQWKLPPPSRPTTGAPANPADVVQRYYAAVNEQDYQTAWQLGGKNLAASYQEFVDGFANTRHDTVSIGSTTADTVAIQLDAEQTDGSHRYYAGTYTVHGGVIVAAAVTPR